MGSIITFIGLLRGGWLPVDCVLVAGECCVLRKLLLGTRGRDIAAESVNWRPGSFAGFVSGFLNKVPDIDVDP